MLGDHQVEEKEEMPDAGLLILSLRNIKKLESLLLTAAGFVKTKLYVRVQGGACLSTLLPDIYFQSSRFCPHLDVRVLLGKKLPSSYHLIGDEQLDDITVPQAKYKKVVLGGTFDRLHNGHKVLLSRAALLASESITCGVTHNDMILKKSLWEMIEPVEKRIEAVAEFVEDVSDTVRVLGEPIDDPFGPSITVPDLEAIVVSDETIKGGEAVNKRRAERDMSDLDMIVVRLLEANDEILKETKISSSSRRRQALGSLLKTPNKHAERSGKVIIGLAGGIASGKSNIAKILREQPDFHVIDCDPLGHSCYAKGKPLVQLIQDNFDGVVINGEVDRKALGNIVFGNNERRKMLNSLVWPAIMDEVKLEIDKANAKFIVIEAAAIVEANWQSFMDELWTVFVPPQEAIQRVMKRDGLNQQQAENRVNSQLPNKNRVDASHVVFCSLWAYEETRKQVMRAVEGIRKRNE